MATKYLPEIPWDTEATARPVSQKTAWMLPPYSGE